MPPIFPVFLRKGGTSNEEKNIINPAFNISIAFIRRAE
jgi:hypothetical protein